MGVPPVGGRLAVWILGDPTSRLGASKCALSTAGTPRSSSERRIGVRHVDASAGDMRSLRERRGHAFASEENPSYNKAVVYRSAAILSGLSTAMTAVGGPPTAPTHAVLKRWTYRYFGKQNYSYASILDSGGPTAPIHSRLASGRPTALAPDANKDHTITMNIISRFG